MRKTKYFALLLFLLLNINSYSLIEYDDGSEFQQKFENKKKPKRQIKRIAPPSKSSSAPVRRNSSSPKFITFSTKYNSISQKGYGKSSLTGFNLNLNTSSNLYLDLSYWMAQTDDSDISSTKSYQKGNPKIKLGFNWLALGDAQERVTIDLLASLTLGEKKSNFAQSRTDKSFGLLTTKRFYSFILGLGYNMTFTGDSKNNSELNIGNIKHIYGTLGAAVSNQIRFAVEAGRYDIGKKDEDGTSSLQEDVIVNYISPKLQLMIHPQSSIELGAVFHSETKNTHNLNNIKIWNLPNSAGNSLYAGVNFFL